MSGMLSSENSAASTLVVIVPWVKMEFWNQNAVLSGSNLNTRKR